MSNGQGGFLPPITLAVGPGISDVSVADVNQDGLLDILLANQTSGEVEVILNLGDGASARRRFIAPGSGSPRSIGGTGTTPLSLFSQDGTVGVAAAALTPGGPPDLVALNSGAETLGVLTGLGGGRFANPYSLPTTGPTSAIRVADLTGDGNADLAILGPDGLTIWLGNGQGRFRPGGHLQCRARSHRPDDRRRQRRQAARPARRQRVRRRPRASGRRQRSLPTADHHRPERRPRGGPTSMAAAPRRSSSPTRPATASSSRPAPRRSRPCWQTAPRACLSRARPCWPT